MSDHRHQVEIERNREIWKRKPILREVYGDFYQRILGSIDLTTGPVVEIGSGIGSLKDYLPQAISSDVFLNPWLDLVSDAYRLPFRDSSVGNLLLFDVWHHLRRPMAFFPEAARVLKTGGRLVLFEPFVSLISYPVYGLLHPEPLGWRLPIDPTEEIPDSSQYYAAQGNATRIFFRESRLRPRTLQVFETIAFASLRYFFSGGFSRPQLAPHWLLDWLGPIDEELSRWPRLFAGRCLVVLIKWSR